MTDADVALLRRAVSRAMRGRGWVEPNPMVGCVLARDGDVIGEGHHEVFGGPHAEPNALAAARETARDATAYVTLEPCCHTDKKTPPCAPRLIDAGVARVVVGTRDPNPKVDGGGVAMLRAAGIEVVEAAGDVAAECRQLIAPFLAAVHHRRPYVTAKLAVSRDGKVAGRLGRPVRITGPGGDRAVQDLRGRCDAIAVGTNTLRNDDPALTARGEAPPRRPIRVLLSNTPDVPPAARLLDPALGPTLIYTAATPDVPHAEVVTLPATETDRGTRRFAFADVLADLHARGVTHLMIEPGPTLAAALLARGQVDRLWVIRGRHDIGDVGLPAPEIPPTLLGTGVADLAGDRLTELLDPASTVFHAAVPSADFVLARS